LLAAAGCCTAADLCTHVTQPHLDPLRYWSVAQNYVVTLNHFSKALGHGVPIERVDAHRQGGLLERLLQAAKGAPVKRAVAEDCEVEVGVVLGGPRRAGAECPHLAVRDVLGQDLFDDGQMWRTEVNQATHRQASPVMTVRRATTSSMKVGMRATAARSAA